MNKEYIVYAGHRLSVLAQVDCCVAGGGTAGVAAAITAGRGGVKTLVIERGISLGGMQTLGLVEPFMPTNAPDSDTPFIREIKERLRQEGIEPNDGKTDAVWTNPELLAYIYDELMENAGVTVLYQAVLVDVLLEKGTLTSVIVQTVEGLAAVKASYFIDATGDAVLSRLAGIPVASGYEKTGYNQPMSFRFEMGGIDIDELYTYIQSIHDTWCKTAPPYFEIAQARHRDTRYRLESFFMEGVKSGELQEEDAEYFQAFTIPGKPGCMSMNCPEIPIRFRATEALSYSKGVQFGRAMMRRISQYLIRHMPGFSGAYLSREAAMLGARESFRIIGCYQMTETDYYRRCRFADAVARTAWYIDAHGEKVGEYLAPGEYYEIPYRSMVTREIKNLIVSGRCISVSFILEASMRIQPTCMSLGEAAGTAVIWAKKKDISLNTLHWETIPERERSYTSASQQM